MKKKIFGLPVKIIENPFLKDKVILFKDFSNWALVKNLGREEMETSWISTTISTNNGKIEQRTYDWRGKSPYVRITWTMIRDLFNVGGDISKIQFGPYKLLQVEHRPWEDVVLYVRDDKLGKIRVFLYRSTRWLDLVYRRFILTLAVWKLADVKQGCIPSWEDIRLIKKFRDRKNGRGKENKRQ